MRTVSFRVPLLMAGLVLASGLPSGGVRAQDQQLGTCRILPGTQRAVGRAVGQSRVTYVSRPRLACEGGVRINADSLVSFEATGFNQLFGNVFFEDATRSLRATNARYFDRVGRLEADGAVRLTDKESGNVLTGENLLYLRAIPPGRPTEELTLWGGRPHALLHTGGGGTGDPAAPARTPYDVTADRIFLRGSSFFQAAGRVEVVRDSLNAFADTLRYEELGERLLLSREARVEQARYDLLGREILLHAPGDTLRRVEARGEGRLLGEDLELEAPFIRMGFQDGTLERLWATPLRPGQELEMTVGLRFLPQELDSVDLARPRARATDFEVNADSIEVQAPGEVLERLFAVGSARAESSARDSLNTPDTPDLVRRDWIRGDTVVALFGEAPERAAGDSVRHVLERLEARGAAASLYRLEPDSAGADAPPDSLAAAGVVAPEAERGEIEGGAAETRIFRPRREPAVHYVTAFEIIIVFDDGQVDRMEVRGLEQGIHLDPSGRPRRAAPARRTGGGR
ncbi:MAG: hypothetical protein RQ751_05645 [Longimicrobiales bacterium]|nr:hypothetical protein [Longimicrobiales bacterium]